MFIVVRSKKADLRPLSLYYYLESPSSISEKSLQTNAQSYISQACRKYLGFRPLLQCPILGIYRPRGRYDIPRISRYLHPKNGNWVTSYQILLIWFNSKYLGDPLQILWDISHLIQLYSNPYKLGGKYLS